MFIEKLKIKFDVNEPIFIEDILLLFKEFTKAYVFRLIKQSVENGNLIKFSRGVYFIPKKTFYGTSTITSSIVANRKYISSGDNIYGIYAGLSLLNMFSISTQIPNTLEIITNNETTRKRVVDIDGIKFVIRKSRFEITKENYSYYVILQLFLDLGTNPNLDDFAKQRIKQYMKETNIDQNRLLKLGVNFPTQAMKNLLRSEVLNGTI